MYAKKAAMLVIYWCKSVYVCVLLHPCSCVFISIYLFMKLLKYIWFFSKSAILVMFQYIFKRKKIWERGRNDVNNIQTVIYTYLGRWMVNQKKNNISRPSDSLRTVSTKRSLRLMVLIYLSWVSFIFLKISIV